MKFDMNKAWSEAMAMVGANREVLVILAGLFFFLPNMALSLVMPTLPEGFGGSEQDWLQVETIVNEFYAQYWWLMLLTFAAVILGWLAMMALLRDDSKPTVGTAVQSGIKGLVPALVALLIYLVGTSFANVVVLQLAALSGSAALAALASLALLFIIVAAMIRLMLVSPVIVIDGVLNPVKALVRSWQLTKGNGLRLFSFFALIVVVYFVLSILSSIVMALILIVAGEETGGFIAAAIGSVISAVIMVVLMAVIASAHRQLSGPSANRLKQTGAHFD